MQNIHQQELDAKKNMELTKSAWRDKVLGARQSQGGRDEPVVRAFFLTISI